MAEILANFPSSGTVPDLRDLLKMKAKLLDIAGDASLSSLDWMLSRPVALFCGNLAKSVITSCSLILLKEKNPGECGMYTQR